MQGLNVKGPVFLKQQFIEFRNGRVYIVKKYKQREKILARISIRRMRKDRSIERDVMPVTAAVMRLRTAMPAMSRFSRQRFIARQPVTMVMMRHNDRQ